MPMDGLTVGFVARELDGALRGGRVDRITQPERDTVVLLIRAENENRRLLMCASPNNARLHLTAASYPNPLEPPALCMLLRKQLMGSRLLSVRQIGGDRVVHVDFDAVNEMGDHVLRRIVLEIMGRHSNLMLLDENGRILEAARHVSGEMSRVRQIQPGLIYLPPPAQDKLPPDQLTADRIREALAAAAGQPLAPVLMSTLAGVSRAASEEIAFRLLQGQRGGTVPENGEAQTELAERTVSLMGRLLAAPDPHVLFTEDGNAADAFPFPYLSLGLEGQKAFRSVSEALDLYYGGRDARDRLSQKSASMLRTLKTHLERCEKKLAMQEEELASAERMEEYRRMGEAINANLYQLRKGMTEATLPDWYGGEDGVITVQLDTRLTPAQNAQRYFRKYQKARNARETAAVQRDKTIAEMDYLEGMLLDVDKCVGESELEEIRQELVRTGYVKRVTNRRMQRKLPQSKPYRYRSSDGIEIWVGKNAAQNDRLTQGAAPDEMWLHAKDMPGSHVLIRKEGEIPRETLREAALLAAWYSKGKSSSLVPVDYTRRRYVKKPSGAAPGKVIYTHQHTAFMTPEEAGIRKITLIEA